ncbi:hypothetical protein J4E93_002406 [Alternaria ventricosa]|uniref:uncharacterized protein n=1 Tax=Alternaria ventricosa TaxID=1187951 RepID=UPI0020C4013E|nr:uncharacterized protein J4E93_002406 [Alternaria ventricosa]KAI4652209.1 hypothetical protein J4E93_002406 [Alternaria ventricosa]
MDFEMLSEEAQPLVTHAHEQEYAKYIKAIDDRTFNLTFEGAKISYLRRSTINALANRQDVTAFIKKTEYPKNVLFHVHDALELADIIEQRGKKLFLLTTKLGLSMEFLSALLAHVDDNDLPMERKKYVIIPRGPHRMAMFKLVNNQALVCAPVLDTGTFDQVVPWLSCFPLEVQHDVREPDVYDVGFPQEHLRNEVEEPSAVWEMEDFGSEKHANAEKSRFDWGVTCEGRWYFFRGFPDRDVDEDYDDKQEEEGEGKTNEMEDGLWVL